MVTCQPVTYTIKVQLLVLIFLNSSFVFSTRCEVSNCVITLYEDDNSTKTINLSRYVNVLTIRHQMGSLSKGTTYSQIGVSGDTANYWFDFVPCGYASGVFQPECQSTKACVRSDTMYNHGLQNYDVSCIYSKTGIYPAIEYTPNSVWIQKFDGFGVYPMREKREIEGVRATYFCDETIPGLKMGLLGVRDYGDGGGKVYHFSLTGSGACPKKNETEECKECTEHVDDINPFSLQELKQVMKRALLESIQELFRDDLLGNVGFVLNSLRKEAKTSETE